jgi:hypothetical protein
MRDSARILAWSLTCAFIFLAAATSTQATTMVYYGTEKLLDDCSFVVLGRVTGVQCAYHDAVYGGTNHEIYTLSTIAIDRTWGDGAPVGTMVIEEIGGSVGTRVSNVDGVPRFTAGDEALLFVERRPDGHFKTFGMYLGVLAVQRDPAGQAFLLRPEVPAGTTVVEAGFARDLIEPDALGRFPMDPFLDAIARRESGEGR